MTITTPLENDTSTATAHTDEPAPRTHRRFDRIARLVGEDAMARLARAHVLVVGCGGVGSFAAEALARSAVGHVTLVDFDLVCVTNSNRQLHAMRGNIGRAKVEVMAERLRLIHPTGRVDARVEFFAADNAAVLLEPRPDYVIDAIDNITAKAHLIVSCRRAGIPLVSSMGAAARIDPTRVRVDDLARTHHDPFAHNVREALRQKHGWQFKSSRPIGIPAVFTDEAPIVPSGLAYDAETGGFHCVCPQSDNGMHTCEKRSRIDGSAAWLSGTFGLVAASVAVRELSGQSVIDRSNVHDPWEPLPGRPPR
ncbi:MAG: tRNA threonylcarbamoyladenosine dehydratase [Deltaproteobacteria bacterium]